MKIELSREALREWEEGRAYYETQLPELGDRSDETMRKALRNIRERPSLYPMVRDPVRRSVLTRFPYNLYYLVDEKAGRIVILAIAHQHRKPRY
jgi:plasmid stabilization system protein ParE